MTQRTAYLLAAGLLLAGCLATQASEPELVQITYPVADLVLPVENGHQVAPSDLLATTSLMNLLAGAPTSPKPATLEAPLMKLIVASVAPQSWAEAGGKGTIDYFPLGLALVVSQTAEVHEQIAAMLESLRKNADKDVVVAVRVVSLSEKLAKQLKEDGVIDCYCCGKNKDGSQEPQVSYMSDIKLYLLMEMLQGDNTAEVMQSPKLTMINGQTATIQAIDHSAFLSGIGVQEDQISPYFRHMPLGLNVAVQPLVSSDQKTIQVQLGLTFTTVASFTAPMFPITTFVTPLFEGGAQGQPIPITYYIQQPTLTTINLNQTVKIPTGSTAVLSGWKYEQESRWEGPPVLSQIPYVKDLFRHLTTQREPHYMLVLVTPRLVESSEKQETSKAPESKPQPNGLVITPESAAAWDWPQQLTPNPGDGMWGWGPTPQLVQPVKYEAPAPKPEADFMGEVRKEMAALLVRKYHQACEKGLTAEAKCIAEEALELDPACFSKARTGENECK